MRLARKIFLVAGVYGLLVVTPMYFLERMLAGSHYPLPNPEFYYGFVGVVIAWQLAFLVIAIDPPRYRMLMLPSMFEKFSYTIAVIVLYIQRRVTSMTLGAGLIDCVLGILFIVAFLETSRAERGLDARHVMSGNTEGAGPLV